MSNMHVINTALFHNRKFWNQLFGENSEGLSVLNQHLKNHTDNLTQTFMAYRDLYFDDLNEWKHGNLYRQLPPFQESVCLP